MPTGQHQYVDTVEFSIAALCRKLLASREFFPWLPTNATTAWRWLSASNVNIARVLPFIGAVVVGIVLTPGVAVTPTSAEQPPGSIPACAQRIYARLFFGLEGPLGSVADVEWDSFLRDVVVPRFPNGLTVTHAKGHWQVPGEPPQREASRVLEIVYDEKPHHDRRIEEIAATYKTTFQQESVMVIRMPANVCF